MALMFGAVVFVMSSCGGKDNKEEAKFQCTCSNTSFTTSGTNLAAADTATYLSNCRNSGNSASGTSVKGGATPKTVITGSCK